MKKLGWDKWIDSAKRSEIKLAEAGIKVRVFDGILGVKAMLAGHIIEV